MAFDLILRNGIVIDGTKKRRYPADMGILKGRIESIGSLVDADSECTIDVTGHVVAPGFIDMHSHSDRSLLDDPGAESKIHQGVTTEVVGNCSFSPYPAKQGSQRAMRAHSTGVVWDWTDLDGWANRLETNGISLNAAPQVGHSAIRVMAGVTENRPPNPDELREMQRLTAESVEQGAFSLTTGLTLPPSSYATTDELVALMKAVAPYENVFYASHARAWSGNHIKAVEECVDIGRQAGVPTQYSHMAIIDPRAYGEAPKMVEAIDRARFEGLDATYDMYPYTAAGTHLQQLTPEWLQEGSVDKMLKRLRHSPTRKRAVEDTAKGYFKGLPLEWDKLVIAFVNTEANQYAIGKSIAEIASARNMSGEETMLALIDEEDNNVGVVIHNRKEIDVRFFLSHPQAMIGSDGNAISPTGVYGRERPHPRFYGTYPRILGRYVREKPSILTLEEAVYKMSGFPAERMRFKNRGTIAKGHIADIVIFDPNTVIDRATFKDPHQYPTGIPYVLVNGELVVSKGKHTGARPGKVLRRGV